jgi:uncharacterized protein YgbK (DUF1537 family)
MMKLLVIADDLTGALDTGVQLAKKGIATEVRLQGEGGGGEAEVLVVDTESRHLEPDAAALRVREAALRGREAGGCAFYKKTDSTLRGNLGAEFLGLLESSPGQRPLVFVPAFPTLKRTTRAGRQYVDGVSLEKTAFAQDRLNPVRSADIAEILTSNCPRLGQRRILSVQPSSLAQTLLREFTQNSGAKAPLVIVDGETEEDLAETSRQIRSCADTIHKKVSLLEGIRAHSGSFQPERFLHEAINKGSASAVHPPSTAGHPTASLSIKDTTLARILQEPHSEISPPAGLPFLAGCAGFGAFLPELLGIRGGKAEEAILAGPVAAVNGSLNPVSLEQVRAALAHGAEGVRLPAGALREEAEAGALARKIAGLCAEKKPALLYNILRPEDAGDFNAAALACGIPEERVHTALPAAYGEVVRRLAGEVSLGVLVVFGGDTLVGILKALGRSSVIPFAEIFPGVVAARVSGLDNPRCIITKAGGFGGEELLANLFAACGGG